MSVSVGNDYLSRPTIIKFTDIQYAYILYYTTWTLLKLLLWPIVRWTTDVSALGPPTSATHMHLIRECRSGCVTYSGRMYCTLFPTWFSSSALTMRQPSTGVVGLGDIAMLSSLLKVCDSLSGSIIRQSNNERNSHIHVT